MRTAILEKPGKIIFKETEKPVPGTGEVLIKVKRIGICGSDIHAFHGKHPYVSYPFIQGHEFSGEVVETGSNVTDITIGDNVTARPQVVCGKCYSCTHGRYNICDNLKVLGFQADGAARDYFPVHHSLVIRLPGEIDDDAGAMVEPLAVGIHALKRVQNIRGLKVLILGAGTIGNLLAQAAKSLGALSVMITDISDFRIKKAKECGIDYAFNVQKSNLLKKIQTYFGKDRADLIFECVGIQDTISQAVTMARKGTDIIIVGVFGDKPSVDMGLVQDRELRLIGTLMYCEEDYLCAIDFLRSKSVKVHPLITDHFPFKEYQNAYLHIEKQGKKIMKVMIDL
jgi:L-iditol 2-dehydrogenase